MHSSSSVGSFTIKPLALAVAFALSIPSAWSAPEGGQIVAGQGAVSHLDNETRIQQASERLSIDWKSFDLNSDERIQFIQPTSSSIAFNRILSDKGSLIQGRIDANGQVVLINPNGLIFTEGASVNAGGLIASALQMNDQDYLNGKFTIKALEGSEGRVINSGLLNAAAGGNISLLGKSVENKGLISAQLGSVNLAAGKGAVLTFDPNGLVGVRVTEAVLQKDLGVDVAVVNSGEIQAEGGKVLITASTSKDIFSKAVNVSELTAAKSAVVNDDGSFTLGAGADVKNTGTVDVSSHVAAGEVVLIGDNISQQGRISADSETGNAGRIEIASKNKSEVKDEAVVSTVAKTQGKGGDIKVLGDKVEIFNSAKLDASGANGGGQVLLGGDQTGANTYIKNAHYLFVGDKTEINASATQSGDGGRLIAFAEDAARVYGQFNATGAAEGYGGFVETSGLIHLDLTSVPSVGGAPNKNGFWLIDPANITIVSGPGLAWAGAGSPDIPFTNGITPSGYGNAFIGSNAIESALNSGGNVYIKTGRTNANITVPDSEGNITVNATSITTTSANNSTLYLDAGRNITFNDASNYQFSLSILATADPVGHVDVESTIIPYGRLLVFRLNLDNG
jgi:filamentous hemagglutinin family protein